jgi:Na+/H+-dicarboxylate symporter
MSFSKRILVGLASGVLVGLFLGERASLLRWAADGFVKLLQMTVLPYVTVSIVGSLGRLRYEDARALGLKTGAVLGGVWLLALAFTFAIPLSFPQVESASFFSTPLVERRPPFNFVDQSFATFINTWIDLKRKDGTLDTLYRYWILGQNPAGRQRRWSVIRDVLHWVE